MSFSSWRSRVRPKRPARDPLEHLGIRLTYRTLRVLAAIAAANPRFEYAAQLRDELRELRRDLREIQANEGLRPGVERGCVVSRRW